MKELNFYEILKNSSRRLNHIRRYSSVPVLRQENVSEHMYWVWFYALLIGDVLQNSWYTVNWERLMKYSLLHDVPEAQTGDILRITKYHDPLIKELIDKAEKDLFDRSFTGVDPQVVIGLAHFTFNAKDDTVEGRIIALCDLLGVFSYCIEEFKLGNENMRIIYNEARGYINSFNDGGIKELNDIINTLPISLDQAERENLKKI